MTAYCCEVRQTVRRRGAPKLVPLAEIYDHLGFRSVYAFPETLANQIKETRTTRGLRGQVVYSDELFLDFDDQPEAANEFKSFLVDGGYAFSEWDSGGRSRHFHVQILPMIGRDVPQQQKQWVSRIAPKADISIYHHAAMYRLPGTFHEKHPGRRKGLLFHTTGEILGIKEDVKAVYEKPFSAPLDAAQDSEDHTVLMLAGAETGGRHPHIFKLICVAIRVGMKQESILRDVLKWNRRRAYPPLPEEEVTAYVYKVYGQQMREFDRDKLAPGEDNQHLQEEGARA